MAYKHHATASAFLHSIADTAKIEHFLQLEDKTLGDALAALGVDLAVGPQVLDVGCGDGRLCRSMKTSGAVCSGCDSSEAMVAVARAAELGADRPTEYYTADATSDALLPGAGSFDLVLSIYVLHMAASEGELQAMCDFLGRHLRPGGAAIILTISGEYEPDARQCELMRRCWGYTSLRAEGGGGSDGVIGKVEFVLGSGHGEVHVINFQYPEATYQRCLERASFEDVRVWAMRAPQQLLSWVQQKQAQGRECGARALAIDAGAVTDAERAELLLRYLANPHVKGFLARKRSS